MCMYVGIIRIHIFFLDTNDDKHLYIKHQQFGDQLSPAPWASCPAWPCTWLDSPLAPSHQRTRQVRQSVCLAKALLSSEIPGKSWEHAGFSQGFNQKMVCQWGIFVARIYFGIAKR